MLRVGIIAMALGATSVTLTGCFPVVATGMVAGALSVSDRRTTGAQAEDQAIELKAFNRFRDQFKSDQVSLSVISFNRIALLTGYAPNDSVRAEAAKILSSIDNVRSVINEVVLGPAPSLRTYGSDTLLTARIKASLVEAKDLQANVIKVYTDSSTVYLMGVVTEREAKRATDIASRVSGVRRVIRAFEVITEAELARIQLQSGGASNAAPVNQPATPVASQSPAALSPSAPTPPPSGDSGTVVTPIR
ncbi:MAG: BON domain-containing protein [Burkholderiaceae bacterium]|nr:BON domain-containing protein [Burkholderiaceae bacterium]